MRPKLYMTVLALACGAAREQQVRHVRAGHEQQQSDRRRQQVERAPETDLVGGKSGTLTGTTPSNHPAVLMPAPDLTRRPTRASTI